MGHLAGTLRAERPLSRPSPRFPGGHRWTAVGPGLLCHCHHGHRGRPRASGTTRPSPSIARPSKRWTKRTTRKPAISAGRPSPSSRRTCSPTTFAARPRCSSRGLGRRGRPPSARRWSPVLVRRASRPGWRLRAAQPGGRRRARHTRRPSRCATRTTSAAAGVHADQGQPAAPRPPPSADPGRPRLQGARGVEHPRPRGLRQERSAGGREELHPRGHPARRRADVVQPGRGAHPTERPAGALQAFEKAAQHSETKEPAQKEVAKVREAMKQPSTGTAPDRAMPGSTPGQPVPTRRY